MTARFANRYASLGLLGEGMMGQVWRVADALEAGAEKALKIIKVEGAPSAAQRDRFMAEYRAMAGLRHPNTVAVHDWGALDDGSPFLVMDLVPGQELADLVAAGPLPAERVYPLLIQLVQALDFVHSRGYVHRDVKAANIRLTPEGTLKLMDFGLMARPDPTGTGAITGTPGYLAPELVQRGPLTPSSDLYAVGCLAYELLTGALPFQGSVGEVLRAHVGTEPRPLRAPVPPGLAKLVMALLDKDPARRPASAGAVLDALAALAGVALARETAGQAASFLRTAELVGRDRELALLDAARAEAEAGRGRALWLDAPAGTGKSRLVDHLAREARLAGWRVLEGAAHDGGMAPYEALGTALRQAGPVASDRARAEWLPALGRALGTDGPHDVARVAEAARAWLAELGGTAPVLWLMDDLHWADPQSVEVLGVVARELGDARVLLLGTLRGDETPAGSPVWRAVTERVPLAPLDRAGQAALLHAMLPDAVVPAPFAAALDAATGGNPFFIAEALRSLLEEGHLARVGGAWRFPGDPAVLRPLTSIEATVKRRLRHLPASARRLAGAAAVLGAGWTPALVAAVTDIGEADVRADLDVLQARQLVVHEGGGAWRFPHDRVREATYADLHPTIRRALHQRAGEALEASDARADAAELARHFANGDGGERAYRWLMQAAEEADAAAADGTALDLWTRAEAIVDALDAPTDFTRRAPLWATIGWNGAMHVPETAIAMLTKLTTAMDAHPGARPTGDDALEPANAWRLLAASLGYAGRPEASLRAAERSRAILAAEAGRFAPAASPYCRCGGLVAAGRIDEAIAASRAAAEAYEAAGDITRFEASSRAGAFALQNACAFQGLRPDPALRDRARGYAGDYGDSEPFTVWFYFGLYAAWCGHVDEAEAYIEMTAQKSRRVAAPPYAWVLYLRPYLLWQRGDHGPALEQLDRALLAYPLFRANVLPFHHALALRGHLLLALGRGPEALAVFDDLGARGEANGLGLSRMLALHGRGRALEATDPAGSRAAFEALKALAAAGPLRNPLYLTRAERGLGRAAMALGDREAARAHLETALTLAVERDDRFLAAHVRRDLGRLALRRGDRAAARALLTAAGDGFAGMRNPHGLHAVTRDMEALLVPGAGAPRPEAPPEARWRLMRGLLG